MPMTPLPTKNEDKKSFSIYLAGSFEKLVVGNIIYRDWRDYFKKRLNEKFPDLEFYDPREAYRRLSRPSFRLSLTVLVHYRSMMSI